MHYKIYDINYIVRKKMNSKLERLKRNIDIQITNMLGDDIIYVGIIDKIIIYILSRQYTTLKVCSVTSQSKIIL